MPCAIAVSYSMPKFFSSSDTFSITALVISGEARIKLLIINWKRKLNY